MHDEAKHPRARDGKFTNSDAMREDPGQVVDFDHSIAEKTVDGTTYYVTAVVPGDGDVSQWEGVEFPTDRPMDMEEYAQLTEALDDLNEQADRSFVNSRKLGKVLDAAPDIQYRIETSEGVQQTFETSFDAVSYLENLTN